jgi:hypothetical protein
MATVSVQFNAPVMVLVSVSVSMCQLQLIATPPVLHNRDVVKDGGG